MSRRDHNIHVFKNLIRSGLSYSQIVRIARRYFTKRVINEYYDIAFDEINNPLEDNYGLFNTPKKDAKKIISKLEDEGRDE
jgi:hypothetical protein